MILQILLLMFHMVQLYAIIGGTTATKQASELGGRISALRKEFTGNNATKDFQKITAAFTKIQSAASNPSPASDMSLIFNYMKMLDPGSTVREGEYATAQNATNIPNRIRNAFNSAKDGTKLNHVQRADFATAAGRIYDGSYSDHSRLREYYIEQAAQVDPAVQNAMPSLQIHDTNCKHPINFHRNGNLSFQVKKMFLNLQNG